MTRQARSEKAGRALGTGAGGLCGSGSRAADVPATSPPRRHPKHPGTKAGAHLQDGLLRAAPQQLRQHVPVGALGLQGGGQHGLKHGWHLRTSLNQLPADGREREREARVGEEPKADPRGAVNRAGTSPLPPPPAHAGKQ